MSLHYSVLRPYRFSSYIGTSLSPRIARFRASPCSERSVDKHFPRGSECRLIGYNGTSIFRMWHAETNKIFISSNVRFPPLSVPSTATNNADVPTVLNPLDRFTPVAATALSDGSPDLSPPTSIKQVFASPDHRLWVKFMERKLSDLERRKTWILVPRQSVPPAAKIASGKWVFTVKDRPSDPHADSDGLLRKSRWVIFGNQLESSSKEDK